MPSQLYFHKTANTKTTNPDGKQRRGDCLCLGRGRAQSQTQETVTRTLTVTQSLTRFPISDRRVRERGRHGCHLKGNTGNQRTQMKRALASPGGPPGQGPGEDRKPAVLTPPKTRKSRGQATRHWCSSGLQRSRVHGQTPTNLPICIVSRPHCARGSLYYYNYPDGVASQSRFLAKSTFNVITAC